MVMHITSTVIIYLKQFFCDMKNKITFLLTCVLFVSCSRKKADKDSMPNFVIIMADDLGYGDISCYGNTYINTPNIDKLASEGVRFTDFHSNGAVSSPTRAALMTGKYQQRTGIEGVVTAKSHRHVGLNLDEITIAEELKKYNYNCGMYGKWHLGYSKEYNPTLQGFDDYTGFVSGNIDYHAHIDQEGYLDWWKGATIDNEPGYSSDLITEYGVKYIKEHNPQKTNKPFFLYLPHEAPHGPYQRRIDKVLREVGKAGTLAVNNDSIPLIYKEMIEVMDEGVDRIMQALKEIGEYENTMVIFLSDNGANINGNNGVLRGYKGGVYEGGTRVPAIITYPNKIKKGTINKQTILTMDVLPTVLDFIGKKPGAENIDGISIKENLINETKLPDRDVFFAYKDKSFIRSGMWKMVRKKDKNEYVFELYNLSVDLSERDDLGSENPDLMINMKEKFEMWETDVREGVELISEY
jgi:arylsulfatase A-like enzyme